MEVIQSQQNDRVKLVKSLQTRVRARRKHRKIVLEGVRLIRDALHMRHTPEFVFYEPQSADYTLVARLQNSSAQLLAVSEEIMVYLSDTQQPQGFLAVFPIPKPPLPKKPSRILVLDNVREPGNMGTVLRTAAAAGTELVVLSPGCVDPYNPKVLRAGMGAHFRLPIVEATWEEIAEYCTVLDVYGMKADGKLRYDQVDWTQPSAIILGSEANGMGPEADTIADDTIHIPMAAQTESLNASVACAIVLFEAARQRLLTQTSDNL